MREREGSRCKDYHIGKVTLPRGGPRTSRRSLGGPINGFSRRSVPSSGFLYKYEPNPGLLRPPARNVEPDSSVPATPFEKGRPNQEG